MFTIFPLPIFPSPLYLSSWKEHTPPTAPIEHTSGALRVIDSLVGGWFPNPSEKNMSQNGNPSPIFGVNIQKMFELPPPSFIFVESCKTLFTKHDDLNISNQQITFNNEDAWGVQISFASFATWKQGVPGLISNKWVPLNLTNKNRRENKTPERIHPWKSTAGT